MIREQALENALTEYLDADIAFGNMVQEPTFAWRQAEARLRQAKIEARAALALPPSPQPSPVAGEWRLTDGKYIEARSDRWGQSSGWALLAEVKRHRLGSADRVPPDDVMAGYVAQMLAAPDMLAALQHLDSCAPADDRDGDPISITVTPEALRDIRAAIARATGGEG